MAVAALIVVVVEVTSMFAVVVDVTVVVIVLVDVTVVVVVTVVTTAPSVAPAYMRRLNPRMRSARYRLTLARPASVTVRPQLRS